MLQPDEPAGEDDSSANVLDLRAPTAPRLAPPRFLFKTSLSFIGLDATAETATIDVGNGTDESPVSVEVAAAAAAAAVIVATGAIRSGLVATSVAPLEPLLPFPNEH